MSTYVHIYHIYDIFASSIPASPLVEAHVWRVFYAHTSEYHLYYTTIVVVLCKHLSILRDRS